MTKNKYMTKYQLEHLKQRVGAEIDPIIDEAKLMRKSVVADLTASAENKLAKKIKADVVIKDLEKAFKNLEQAQRKAKTFFTKGVNAEMKNDLKYSFKDLLTLVVKNVLALRCAISNCCNAFSNSLITISAFIFLANLLSALAVNSATTDFRINLASSITGSISAEEEDTSEDELILEELIATLR